MTMNRYSITVQLSDGDRIEAKSVGDNQEQALARLQETEAFVSFIGGRDIDSVDIAYIGKATPVNPDDFILQQGSKPGWWVATDKVHNVVVQFEQGRFNDTARITPLFDSVPAKDMPTVLREIGEYLALHHGDIV